MQRQPMKSVFPCLVANAQLKNQLSHELTEGNLSHAYILEGAFGTGKHTVALQIAAALACECKSSPDLPLPCGQCPSCKKILSHNSPDVIYINRGDKATLGVEAVRELKQDVYVAPNDISEKIYIIEEAHLMTVQAQNALLLTLEEPPPYVLFLLLCESTTPLLETIRSRAPTLRTEQVDTPLIGDYLKKNYPKATELALSSPNEFAELLASAGGSIGQAILLLDANQRKPVLSLRQSTRTWLKLCAEKRDVAATVTLIAELAKKKREVLIAQCNSIQLALRDLLLYKQTESFPLCFFTDKEEVASLSYVFTVPQLLQQLHAVANATDRLQANANVRLTLTSLAADAGLL